MKKSLSLFLSVVFLFSQWGCATIVNGGRKEAVSIRSNPSGATAYVNGTALGITPFFANLSRRNRYEIQFVKDGYNTETRYLTRTFNWWVLGNIFLGGLPVIVDLAYGNQFKFDHDDLNGILVPLRTAE